MAPRSLASLVFGGLSVAAVGAGLFFAGCFRMETAVAEAAPPPPQPVGSAGNGTPVLLELFTSEGCSSCPSADVVAAKILRTQPVAGARVIVLAHHVDYWNQLGWPDPFSSAAASARQRAYAPLKSGSYTPQAVIDGRAEMVGSRGSAIEEAIAASSKQAHAKVDLDVTPAPDNKSFDVTARTAALPAGSGEAELLLAVVQDRGRVAVPRGENSGSTLDHSGIVRSLKVVAPAPGAGTSAKTAVQVPAAIDAPDGTTFSVVAFVQERTSRKVLGSASAPLAR